MTINLITIIPTFMASLSAVGTAATMAFAGFYMHRKGFVTPSGKKMMALLSQQVTIPAFLFAKIIYCPPSRGIPTSSLTNSGDGGYDVDDYDFDTDDNAMPAELCPSVASKLGDVWMLVLWPFFVVFCGLFVGDIAAKISRCPPGQRRSCLAACAFGNSTGLVMTLLEVIHGQADPNSEFGRIDATAYLSVYLLLYPVLQWGMGGWLLAPEEKESAGKTLYESNVDLELLAKKDAAAAVACVTNGGGEGGIDMYGSGALPPVMTGDAESGFHHNGPATAAAELMLENVPVAPSPHNHGDDGIVVAPPKTHKPYRINHLLNREVNHFSSNASYAAFEAGQEEFGGVPHHHSHKRHHQNRGGRSITNRHSNSSLNSIQGNQGSSSGFSMLMRELSFTSHDDISLGGSVMNADSVVSLTAPALINVDGGNGNGGVGANGNHGHDNNNSSNGQRKEPTFIGGLERTNSTSDGGPLYMEGEDANGKPGTTIHEHAPLLGKKTPNETRSPSPVRRVRSRDRRNSMGGSFKLPDVVDNGTVVGDGNDKNSNPEIFPRVGSITQMQTIQESDVLPFTETLYRIAVKVFQPPVIGALAGLLIASIPRFRGVFQDIWGIGRDAPLQWLFQGVYSVGQAAVPVNMTILGINLSSTFQKKKKSSKAPEQLLLPNNTMVWLVFGKMIVMPILGILSTWFLKEYCFHLPDEIDATCYLVMMIVFITPTANNVMVMVELSGSGSKEGMARLIGWMYVASPIVLSAVLSVVVHLASCTFNISDNMC